MDGKLLLDGLAATLKRFVILPPWAAEPLALWAVHTYAFQFRDVTTYIGLESPEKRCGKTTLLAVLSELVQRPVVAANISSPALFRVIEETRPTLLIDEADSFLRGNEELRGILNSGYTRKTAYVVRVAHERKRKVAKEDRPQNTNSSHQFTPGPPAQPQPRSADFQVCCIAGLQTCPPPEPAETAQQQRIKGDRAVAPAPADRLLNTDYRSPAVGPSRLAHFTTWCPKVMAAIGRLPDTLADRCPHPHATQDPDRNL